jgi:glutamate/tyrosine decarboxylase-like PLP-dependent enzyme
MSPEGVSGLEGLRNRLDRTVDTLSDVRAEVSRQGAEQAAQGREIAGVKHTLEDVDGKVDGILSELASGRGQVAQKKSSSTGLKDVVIVVTGVSGVVAAIVFGLLK